MSIAAWRAVLVLPLALTVCASCAKRATQQTGTFPSRDVITRADIARTHAQNAYDAVERLHGQWLRERGTSQMPASGAGPQFEEAQVQVYLDGQRMGTVDNLRRIEVAAVEYIQFIPPAEASSRWGFGHGAGVIFVSTRPM